jgi:hypothetical protein
MNTPQNTDSMKEKIADIILQYQNEISNYFEMEVSMEYDAEHMDAYLENMKVEILNLFNI